MKKISVLILIVLMTGCAEFNEPNNPCGIYGDTCLIKTPINQ